MMKSVWSGGSGGLVLLSLVVACGGETPVQPDAVPARAASAAQQTVAGASRGGEAGATKVLEDADQGGRQLAAALVGAEEAPGPGDPDGTGSVVLTLNPGVGEVCFELTAANIEPATAAHVHEAAPGSPGPVVVPLTPPTDGSSSGCVTTDRDLIREIIQRPGDYYVNVHNAPFPAGAIRGQLGR
jgi:hypothetical protein